MGELSANAPFGYVLCHDVKYTMKLEFMALWVGGVPQGSKVPKRAR